jgi:hypothetical protein
MKDNRFIELVNLYIDRQITGEEMAALEAEMQENPRRRAVYRQYCQMHRATTLVYESFRSDTAGQSSEAVARDPGIARFEPQTARRRSSWAYYATGLAAACVALAFARANFSKTSGQNPANAALSSKQAAAVAVAQPPATPAPAEAVAPRANPATVRTNKLVAELDYAAMLAAMRREEQRSFAGGQVPPSRTPSLFEDGVFDSQPASSPRVFGNKQTSAQQAEFAAFQFQR